MWSERDIAIAKQLIEPETIAFLQKVFVDIATSNGDEVAKNVVALDDAEYGRIMKVVFLVKQENKAKINLLRKIANTKLNTAAPRALAPK